MHFALAVLPENEQGSADWCAIKTNIANAYMLRGGKDAATDAETSLRHLNDVLRVMSSDDKSPHWAWSTTILPPNMHSD